MTERKSAFIALTVSPPLGESSYFFSVSGTAASPRALRRSRSRRIVFRVSLSAVACRQPHDRQCERSDQEQSAHTRFICSRAKDVRIISASRQKREAGVVTGENDPVFWRAKAEEARTTADALQDPRAQENMLAAARCYERLAELAEQTLAIARKKKAANDDAA